VPGNVDGELWDVTFLVLAPHSFGVRVLNGPVGTVHVPADRTRTGDSPRVTLPPLYADGEKRSNGAHRPPNTNGEPPVVVCSRETMESMLTEHHMLRAPMPVLDPATGLGQLTAEERAVLAARSQLFLRAAAAAAAVGGPYGPLCGIYNAAAAAGGQHLWTQWASLQSPAGLYQQLAAVGGGGGGGCGAGANGGPTSMAAVAAAAAAVQQQQQQHSSLYQQQHPAGNGFRFSPYLVTAPPPPHQPQPLPVGGPSPSSSPDTGAGSPPDRSPRGGHRTTPR